MDRNNLASTSLLENSNNSGDVSSPLLGNVGGGDEGRRRGSLSGAARFLRRAGNRRIMREPSMVVRETAAEQLEQRQSDWANSRPVVVLDLVWNLAFVIVALVVLVLSKQERPRTPLRVWILGYALQCALHMICVCIEYRRRYASSSDVGPHESSHSSAPSEESESDIEYEIDDTDAASDRTSFARRLESANTVFSFVWWLVGFYWITYGGQALTHDSPRLYWLCVVFLAFDVIFVVFCVALACVIGIAVCCCLPCIIAILYAVADQEGASEEDISLLPKYKFRRMDCPDKVFREKAGPFGGAMISISSEIPNERILSAENAECCICLSIYDDGAELRELPCNHHFHCACIDKWLRINATCPLCKYNIIKSNNNGRDEA